MSALGVTTYVWDHCRYCGEKHREVCGRIKRVEYHPNGAVKSVELHPPMPTPVEPTDDPPEDAS